MILDFKNNKIEIEENGYSLTESIYTDFEISQIISVIENADSEKDTFRKSSDLFAIRQFHKEVPEVLPLLLNDNFKMLVKTVMGTNCFITKSIYFDKPETSNWFVSYHQDLTISVDKKIELEDYKNWTTKQNQFSVQPSIDILENITTFRIHLDDTTSENGALKVIEKSHLKKIFRPESINFNEEKEVSCNVKKGGIMLMKPLTLHASNRTINHKKRRVIHVEISHQELPHGINWSERFDLF